MRYIVTRHSISYIVEHHYSRYISSHQHSLDMKHDITHFTVAHLNTCTLAVDPGIILVLSALKRVTVPGKKHKSTQ